MTPEEKAKELIEKYAEEIPSLVFNDQIVERDWTVAKACARICVEEILNDKEDALDVMNDAREITFTRNSMQYWQSVLTHINQQ